MEAILQNTPPSRRKKSGGWLRIVLIAVATLVLVAFTGTPSPAEAASQIKVDLFKALQQQLITASFTSTGGASGNIVNITLKRVKAPADSDLIITFLPGLILTNPHSSQQNMVLLRPTVMELVPRMIVVSTSGTAFCSTLHKDNPAKGTSMKLSGQGSHDLVSLIKAELPRHDSLLVIQAAVWAITDNPTRDDLNQVGYQLSDKDLQAVRELLRSAGLDPAKYRLTS